MLYSHDMGLQMDRKNITRQYDYIFSRETKTVRENVFQTKRYRNGAAKCEESVALAMRIQQLEEF